MNIETAKRNRAGCATAPVQQGSAERVKREVEEGRGRTEGHYAKRVEAFNAEACEYRRPLSSKRVLHGSHAPRTYLSDIKSTTRSS